MQSVGARPSGQVKQSRDAGRKAEEESLETCSLECTRRQCGKSNCTLVGNGNTLGATCQWGQLF